jgi:hypothetical protein
VKLKKLKKLVGRPVRVEWRDAYSIDGWKPWPGEAYLAPSHADVVSVGTLIAVDKEHLALAMAVMNGGESHGGVWLIPMPWATKVEAL